MKKIFLLCCTTLSLLLTGCLDTVEEITLNANGTGTYKSTMDMSGMFDMLESLAAMDTSGSGMMGKLGGLDMDTTFAMDQMSDTSAKMSEEERRLLKGATMHMTMSQEKRVMRMMMNFSFSKPEDIQKLMGIAGSGKGGFNLLSGKAFNEGASGDAPVPGLEDIYNFTFRNGLMERKVNTEKLSELKESEQFSNMGESEQMMEAITYKTIIRLPRPARKAEGGKLTLSSDRKTVTIQSTLSDLFNNAPSLNFRIEY